MDGIYSDASSNSINLNLAQQLGISKTDKIYQAVNKVNFWQATTKNGEHEKASFMDLLKQLTDLLNLEVKWAITEDDKAWCYIDPKVLSNLQQYSLEPIVIRKTKTDQYILLLENISPHNLSEIIDKLKAQCNIALSYRCGA